MGRPKGVIESKPRKSREDNRCAAEVSDVRWNRIFERLIDPDYYTGVRLPSCSPIETIRQNGAHSSCSPRADAPRGLRRGTSSQSGNSPDQERSIYPPTHSVIQEKEQPK